MEREIRKVAVYVRKSREEETEDTLNRQQEVLLDHCRVNKWDYDLYKEVGSSQDLDRPQLQAMLKKIKTFHYDGVLVADLDRLSRNTIHFGIIKEIFISVGCKGITLNKIYDFSKDDDDFMSDIQSVLSKQEYQSIRRRLRRGTRQSAKDGNWMGKKSPIGYKYNKSTKRLELSEDAPIIKNLFKLYREGLSTKEIAYRFANENVVTSVGMIWTPAGVSRILNNIVYAGHSLYGRTSQKKVNGKRVTKKTANEEQILVMNTHKGIVTQKEWEEIQRIKDLRNSRPVPLKLGKHKFSGLICCGLCGAIHSFQTSRNKKRITSCQTRIYNDEGYRICKNKGANLEEFEKIFYVHFQGYIEKLESYIELIKEKSNNKIDYESEIDVKKKKLKKLANDIKRVQQGFLMEIFTEKEAHEQIKTIKSTIKEIEKEIEKLKRQEEQYEVNYLEERLRRMKLFLLNGGEMEEREANKILREFVKTIIYTKTNEKMELNIIMK